MISKFALTALLALAVCAPAEQAAAQESTLGGALFGGVAAPLSAARSAAIAVPRRRGARRATGAAIGAQGEPRPGGYRYYQNGCYVQQGDGSWVGVSPRYCQTAEYAPREQYAPWQQYYEERIDLHGYARDIRDRRFSRPRRLPSLPVGTWHSRLTEQNDGRRIVGSRRRPAWGGERWL